MLSYTLRQLEYFIAAAERGSVADAAAQVAVSQPSVSNAIAKLERQFGVQLFIRHHAQGVSLTPAGRRILADARSLLRHAGELQHNALSAGEALSGELELGCFTTIAPLFMPRLITAFSAQHEGISIRLHEGIQHELFDGLLTGRFELALLYDLDLPPRLDAQPMATYQPYALLPPGHRLVRRAKLKLQDLQDEPLILLDVPPSRDYFTGLFREAGIEPRVAFSSPSLEMVRGLVGRGWGCSLLVTRPHGDHSYDGQKPVIRPLVGDLKPGEICLARLRQVRPTRLMGTFSRFCRDWFREAA